jgi:hypothetical protein
MYLRYAMGGQQVMPTGGGNSQCYLIPKAGLLRVLTDWRKSIADMSIWAVMEEKTAE